MAQLVKKNESTAANRRLYFFLVDSATGLTGVTSAEGSPEISIDGGTWTTTGIGSLVEIGGGGAGNGYYYAELDQSTVNISSGIIQGRMKAVGAAEAPSLNQIQVVPWGPFDDWQGGTFSTTTDSLEAIRNAIDALVGVSASSISLSSAAGNFINNVIAFTRQGIDEASVNAKYTDSDLLGLVTNAWSQVWTDLLAVEDHAPRGRFSVSIASGTQVYVLPPNIEKLERIYQVDTDTGLPLYELYPRARNNPGGPSYTLEGNALRMTPIPTTTVTLVIEYIPGGTISPIEGTGDTTTAGSLTISTVTAGSKDQRENSYVGYMLRVTDSLGYTEERIISAYDRSASKVSFVPDLSSDYSTAVSQTFELVPDYGLALTNLLSTQVSRKVVAQEGNTKRFKLLSQLYREEMRAVRMKAAKMNERRAPHMEGDTVDNRNYRSLWQLNVPSG